jgi:arylsulfatase A-like enzyme
VYAGLLEHTDHHMGRLIDTLADLHLLDEMLIVVLIRDNGASAEESFQGCFNVTVALTGEGHLETIDFLRVKIDLLGRPKAYNHYAVCWAHPMNTPDSWTKQVATHWRGTRNGLGACRLKAKRPQATIFDLRRQRCARHLFLIVEPFHVMGSLIPPTLWVGGMLPIP